MAADPVTSRTVDDLLDLEFSDDDDPFKDPGPLTSRGEKSTLSPGTRKRRAGDEEDDKENFFGLGLDEEVKITKKRKPIAKLDEDRLLSQPGIPKLRAVVRSGQMAKKLGLKGKGHEFPDAARLLTYFQLWLDNLYPRAKFSDGLQMVEKVGHSKRMQILRKGWIDEGKPGWNTARVVENERNDNPDAEDGRARPPVQPAAEQPATDNTEFFVPMLTQGGDRETNIEPDVDELDALLAQEDSHSLSVPGLTASRVAQPASDDEEDALDALLAEHDMRSTSLKDLQQEPAVEANKAAHPERRQSKPRRLGPFEEDSEDDQDDDLDALLAAHDSGLQSHKTAPQEERHSSSQIPSWSFTGLPSRNEANDTPTDKIHLSDATQEHNSPNGHVEHDGGSSDENGDRGREEEGEEGEDDLDALLAEQESRRLQRQSNDQGRAREAETGPVGAVLSATTMTTSGLTSPMKRFNTSVAAAAVAGMDQTVFSSSPIRNPEAVAVEDLERMFDEEGG